MDAVWYVKKMEGFGVSPHSPVRLAIWAGPRRLMVRRMIAPHRVPAVLPAGCLTKEQASAMKEGGEEWERCTLEEKIKDWFEVAEKMWSDMAGKEGRERARMEGRATGPRFRWKSALGPLGCAALYSTMMSRSWSKIVGWCGTIKQMRAHVLARADANHPLARAAAIAKRRIMAAKKWKWKEGKQKDALIEFVEACSKVELRCDGGELVALTAWAEEEAERASRSAAVEANRRYREWLQQGPGNGLARQHAASKCRGQWVPGKMVKERGGQEEALTQMIGQLEQESEQDWRSRRVATVQTREEEMEVPANVQQEVDDEGERWSEIWAGGAEEEECQWPADMEELEDIQAHHIREASKTFAEGVGLGWDRLHPRALRRLPDAVLERLAKIMMEAERLGSWREAVGVAITALIPKGGGGLRPIGLLPALVRVWARVRGGIVRKWETENERDYLYGGKGKGAQIAAWKFAARAEAARLDGVEYAASLLDLQQAFDKVPHHHLVRAARRWRYPMRVLRLSLSAYRMGRVVGIGGIFSSIIKPIRGLAAGSAHATRELRALMIGVFDEVWRVVPSSMPTVYVDDGTLECVGTHKSVVMATIIATRVACEGLEGVGMILSRTKNKVLATRKRVGMEIQEGLKEWNVRYSVTAKMLGVGAAAAVRRTTTVLVERIAAFARRRGQFAKLRKVGVDVARLLRTGGLAGAQFGQAAAGISDYQLMQLRRRAAGVVGGVAAGKDANLVLIAADARWGDKADPAFSAHADTVVQWAEAVWSGILPIQAMQRTMRKAKLELAKAKRQWSVVKGPAAAMVATLARIGWTAVDATTVYSDQGEEVAFTKDPPAMIKKMIHEAVRRWRWRLTGIVEGSPDREEEVEVDWKPVADLIARGKWREPDEAGKRRMEVISKGEQAALRSAVVGGQWPQVRLYQAGLCEVPWCALCLAFGVEVRGTLAHRIYRCPHVEERVGMRRPRELQEEWEEKGRGEGDAMKGGAKAVEWERGLVTVKGFMRRRREEKFEWIREPTGIVEQASIYMDGSMYDGFCDELAVYGWAFVIVKEGAIAGLARGVPPAHVRSIPATEAWALAMAVERVALESACFYTDCKAVKDLALGGVKRATSAKQQNARTWNTLFARTDGERPQVEWIPSHLSESHIGVAVIGDGTLLTREQWAMNALVDEQAKMAAREVRYPMEVIRGYIDGQRRVAMRAAWIAKATYAANNGKEEPYRDVTTTQGGRGGGAKRSMGESRASRMTRAKAQPRPPQAGGHELRKDGGGWSCARCRRSSGDWGRIARGRCGGSVAGLWARRAQELGGLGGSDGAGHVRAAKGEMVWCVRCGSYAVKWAVGLAGPCLGGPQNPSQKRVLQRLNAGRHPRSNEALMGELLLEVRFGAQGGRAGGTAGMTTTRGRSAVGYLRRHGGAAMIVTNEGGRGGEVRGGADEEEVGPRAEMMRRRRRMQLRMDDYRGGEERLRKRRRAHEAREEDEAVNAAIVRRLREAIEAGKQEEVAEEARGVKREREGTVQGGLGLNRGGRQEEEDGDDTEGAGISTRQQLLARLRARVRRQGQDDRAESRCDRAASSEDEGGTQEEEAVVQGVYEGGGAESSAGERRGGAEDAPTITRRSLLSRLEEEVARQRKQKKRRRR